MTDLRYAVPVQPPSPEDGCYLATVPDLPGCMSDGDTREAALVNMRDAIATWIEAVQDLGHAIPGPSRNVRQDAA